MDKYHVRKILELAWLDLAMEAINKIDGLEYVDMLDNPIVTEKVISRLEEIE